MIRSLLAAVVLAGAMTILFTAPAGAQSQALATQNGKCLSVSNDGQSVVVRTCERRFNVSLQGNVIRVFLRNGTEGCLDGYTGKGSAAEAVGCDGTREQDWYVHPSGQIQNVATNLCLDIEGASNANGARVISWDCNSGAWNQKFAFSEMGAIGGLAGGGGAAPVPQPANPVTGGASGGGQVIVNNGGNLIGADGASLVAAGAGNIVAAGAGNIVAAGAGNAVPTYGLQSLPATTTGPLVTSLVGNRCVDVPYGSREPGTQLVLWDCNGQENQQYTWTQNGELQTMGLCVDAFGGGGNAGDAIGTWSCNGGANQRWTLTAAGELRGMNNRCIDVVNGDGNNGAKLVLWDCHGGPNQQWQAVSP